MNKNDYNKVKLLLKDFSQEKKLRSGLMSEFHKHTINTIDFDKCRLLRYLFSFFLKFQIWDKPFEKVNWEIPFTYKGNLCSCAQQKFGFRIYIDKRIALSEAEKLFDEIIKKLSKALDKAEPFVREEGIQMLSKGEIIICNHLRELEARYDFFRKNAVKLKRKMDTDAKFNYHKSLELRYFLDAAYVSFFSLVEHLCMLVFAFSKGGNSIEEVAAKNWGDKYKAVFSLTDNKMKEFYDGLMKLSKYRRNPTVHGYLDKLNTIFHFYSRHAQHRIPMNIYDRKIISEANKSNIDLRLFDEFLRHLRSSEDTKRMMEYLDANFDIACSPASLRQNKIFLSLNDVEAKQYIEYAQEHLDAMADMDW